MIHTPVFSKVSTTPLYKQFTDFVMTCIRNGEFKRGEILPSINAMSIRTGISKETIIKGYNYLVRQEVLVSHRGKGYYIKDSFLTGLKSVIVLMDKMSQHQLDIMEGFLAAVGTSAEVTIRMHYQDPHLLENLVNASVGRYDWYILFPHFPYNPSFRKKIAAQIEKIPKNKLILIDHLIENAPVGCGASFQSIEIDVPEALNSVIPDIRKFQRLLYLPLSVSLYKDIIAESIRQFCRKNNIEIGILEDTPKKVEKGDLFFVSGAQLDRNLSELIKTFLASGLEIGKDLGLICYNEFPLNEYILGGLTSLSVDFQYMGRKAGEMVMSGNLSKIHCHASLIRRRTF